jgi:hypothetical protein
VSEKAKKRVESRKWGRECVLSRKEDKVGVYAIDDHLIGKAADKIRSGRVICDVSHQNRRSEEVDSANL